MPKINIVKFREDVRKAKNDLHVTQKQLAKAAGVGHTTLSKLVNKKLKYLTHKSVTGLCSALGLDAADYYVTTPELQREDVMKTYVGAKATLARANAILDDAQTKLDALQAKPAEDTPEEENAAVTTEPREEDQTVEDRLKLALHTVEATEQAILTVSRERDELVKKLDAATKEQKETELEFIDAKNKIAELKNALDIKNRSIAEKSRLVDSLTADLRADDELILALLDFIQRLKDGDVER